MREREGEAGRVAAPEQKVRNSPLSPPASASLRPGEGERRLLQLVDVSPQSVNEILPLFIAHRHIVRESFLSWKELVKSTEMSP